MKNLSTPRKVVYTLIAGVVLTVGFLVGRATAAQPHMRNALDHLISARAELQEATRDKGGHRVKAIGLINDAIAEVKAGIAAGAE